MKRNSLLFSILFGLTLIAQTLAAQIQSSTPGTLDADLQPFSVAVQTLNALKPGGGVKPTDGPDCDSVVALYAQIRQIPLKVGKVHCPTAPLDVDYILVNYVEWTTDSAPVPHSSWYLLSPASPRLTRPSVFANLSQITTVTTTSKVGDRIFGSTRVGVLFVHRGLSGKPAAKIHYTATSTHKKSVQADDLSALIEILSGTTKAAADVDLSENVLAVAGPITSMPRLPIDINLTGEAFLTASAAADAKPDQTFSQSYDDEGYARYDVSAAIPVTGIKDVQYTQVGSTVSAKSVTRANAYALAHFYPVKVDLKGDYPSYPSFVAGLALSGKPLDKPFVGIAVGTKKPFPFQVNVFAGAVFNKVFTPASTTNATLLNSHRVTKLLYGIDIPIGRLVKAISGQ